MAKERELTFGEKAVGLTFNPSKDSKVDEVKRLYAQIIDLLNDERDAAPKNDNQKIRHLALAITDAETAQMRAVKGLTWGL